MGSDLFIKNRSPNLLQAPRAVFVRDEIVLFGNRIAPVYVVCNFIFI